MGFFRYDDLQQLHELFPPEAAGPLTHLVLFAGVNVELHRRPTDKCNSVSWNQFIVRRTHPTLHEEKDMQLILILTSRAIPGQPHPLGEAPPPHTPPRHLPQICSPTSKVGPIRAA